MISWAELRSQALLFPNMLSIGRGFGGISLAFLLLHPSSAMHTLAYVVFGVSAITDYFDGIIARRQGTVSDLGKIVDPFSDKLLILTPLACFVHLGMVSLWWIVPIFLREIVVTFCRFGWMAEGRALGAEKLGKIKFVFQVVLVVLGLFRIMCADLAVNGRPLEFLEFLFMLVLVLTVLVTLVSGFTFLNGNRIHFDSKPFARFTAALGVGLLPVAPGTWGSLLAIPFVFLMKASPWLYAAGFIATVLIGHWAMAKIGEDDGEDPGYVILDEVAGIWITFMFLTLDFRIALTGFLLFRLFDIWKPPPLRLLEKLPRFWGILMDDVGAGIYAWIVLRVVFIGLLGW